MERNEKIQALSKKLMDGVQQTFGSNRFKQYLKTMSVFHDYSPRNVALIFIQNPTATYVAGFEEWKKLGRHVRRGETGISIFVPTKTTVKMEKPILDDNDDPVFGDDSSPKTEKVEKIRFRFSPVTVFDISQTDGEPLPALCKELQGAIPNFQQIFSAVEKLSPYKIVFEPMPNDDNGCCSHKDKIIALKPGMSDAQIVKTLLHEYTHAVLHKDTEKSKGQKEIEAEGIAFIVSELLGVDTSDYSFDYVSVWSHGMDTDQLLNVLEGIQTDANKIISSIDAEMKHLERTRNAENRKLPERLSEAVKLSEKLNTEKEMIPSGKLLAEQ